MKLWLKHLIIISILLVFVSLSAYAYQITFSNSCFGVSSTQLRGNCEVGCCVDPNGFEHENYPKGLCKKVDGRFYSGECNEAFVCGQ